MPDFHQKQAGFNLNGHFMPAAARVPGLHIVATPIGNLSDITLRALNILAAADLVYCEDTRITSRLFSHYQITTPLKPYHDHNGARMRPQIVAAVEAGAALALVSDAGTPLVSDPGFKLVRELKQRGLPVHMVPGPSAPIMAMALSGFACDRFQFSGFLPPKSTARIKVLKDAAEYPGLSVFFESPKRLRRCLEDASGAIPHAKIAIGRELTKKFEEVLRGSASELLEQLAGRDSIKGEITLVIAPDTTPPPKPDDAEVVEALKQAVTSLPAAQAAMQVAKHFGLQKKQLYGAAVAAKKDMK